MALIECPECGGKVSDKAPTCIHCGYPLQEQTEQQIQYCPYCGKTNNIEIAFCGYCGRSFTKSEEKHEIISSNSSTSTNIMDYRNDSEISNDMLKLQQTQVIQNQQQLEEQRKQFEAQAKCPCCGSTSLSGGKQGFGVGKAVAGVILFGGIGALAGGIGANKTVVTCIKCGHKFKI